MKNLFKSVLLIALFSLVACAPEEGSEQNEVSYQEYALKSCSSPNSFAQRFCYDQNNNCIDKQYAQSTYVVDINYCKNTPQYQYGINSNHWNQHQYYNQNYRAINNPNQYYWNSYYY